MGMLVPVQSVAFWSRLLQLQRVRQIFAPAGERNRTEPCPRACGTGRRGSRGYVHQVWLREWNEQSSYGRVHG